MGRVPAGGREEYVRARVTTDNRAEHRLATYGTLAPGRPNHHQLDGLDGRWFDGMVRGNLMPEGWGAELGYPGLVIDPAGGQVPVHVFESADLPAHWPRLDAFEGAAYARVETRVDTASGTVPASIYVLVDRTRDSG